MKTTIRLIGVVATAMVLSIAFSGVALATQPVCPPPETDAITSTTMISAIGMMSETEKVSWETSNEDLINNPPLGDQEVIGKMDYYQNLKVTDGVTDFIKDMDVDTSDTPNLNVMKSIGYSQAGSIGSLSHDEEVGFGIVADHAMTQDVILCPFASAAQEVLPASCADVTASSSMVVTEVLATTVTGVEISESPVSLDYQIVATGLGGAGTLALGSITATFDVYTEDGSGSGPGNAHCSRGIPANYTLGSTLRHSETSTANGAWTFHKAVGYTSVIRP